MVEKIIEKGVEVVIGAAWTAACGAVTYMLLSGNKDAKNRHESRMARLTEEYNALNNENNQ